MGCPFASTHIPAHRRCAPARSVICKSPYPTSRLLLLSPSQSTPSGDKSRVPASSCTLHEILSCSTLHAFIAIASETALTVVLGSEPMGSSTDLRRAKSCGCRAFRDMLHLVSSANFEADKVCNIVSPFYLIFKVSSTSTLSPRTSAKRYGYSSTCATHNDTWNSDFQPKTMHDRRITPSDEDRPRSGRLCCVRLTPRATSSYPSFVTKTSRNPKVPHPHSHLLMLPSLLSTIGTMTTAPTLHFANIAIVIIVFRFSSLR